MAFEGEARLSKLPAACPEDVTLDDNAVSMSKEIDGNSKAYAEGCDCTIAASEENTTFSNLHCSFASNRFHNANRTVVPLLVASKRRKRWLCQQFGFPSKCERKENFLNLSDVEIKRIKLRQNILALKEEAEFQKMFSSYTVGVAGDEGIMKDVKDLVARYDERLARKKMALHRKWHQQVYEFIDEQVHKKLDMLSSDQIKDKLRHLHYSYINTTNRKMLFRDVITNDYDPFQGLKSSIKCSINGLLDPIKHDLIKETYEKLFIGDKVTKYASTRTILDMSKWTSLAFRSTLWGHINADDEDGSEIIVKDLEYDNVELCKQTNIIKNFHF